MKTCEDEVRAYLGMPPHDTWTNICYYDSFYLQDLKKRYGDEEVAETMRRLKQEG